MPSHYLIGDRPLNDGAMDRLGFQDVAKRIALSLIDQGADAGLVVGLEGKWGSGKSSFLFLIERELERVEQSHQPTIIKFRPWLIGNRDALLTSLLTDLAAKIDDAKWAKGDATGVTVAKAKKTASIVRRFAAKLKVVGDVIEVGGDLIPIPGFKWVGTGFQAIAKLGKDKSEAPILSDLKEKITQSLTELGHRFVVTIDDVDRLEPSEVTELLRLIRSVADFPNVTYVLCYDQAIIAHSIEEGAKVKDGASFLEKIVQLTLMVPQPEPFQLRNWFADSLREIASVDGDEAAERLRMTIDSEGGRRLLTPRAVVRALDASRLFWPPLQRDGADLSDLVWLLLIKDGNPSLYRWIETYCGLAAAISLGTAQVEEAEQKQILNELLSSNPPNWFDDTLYRHYFAEQLPGVSIDYAQDGTRLRIFENVPEHERDAAIVARRLKSPDHYRLYFALASPSHALSQSEFDAFWQATRDGSEAVTDLLLEWHRDVLSGLLSKADILLDRIANIDPNQLTDAQCENLLSAFANCLDDAYRHRPFDTFWFNNIWDRAERMVPRLLRNLSQDKRASLVKRVFAEGRALSWLTSLLRHETFAHGRYGNQSKPEEKWLLDNANLDLAAAAMIARYQKLTVAEVISAINPISTLFAWRQAGDEDGPRKLLSTVNSNEDLVRLIEGLSSKISSSDRGRFEVVKRENLEPFANYDAIKARILQIADSENDKGLKDRAVRLVTLFHDGEDY